MFQNGQTEPSVAWVTRRRTWVRREAKFVRSKRLKNNEKSKIFQRNINVYIFLFCIFCIFVAFCGLGIFNIPLFFVALALRVRANCYTLSLDILSCHNAAAFGAGSFNRLIPEKEVTIWRILA